MDITFPDVLITLVRGSEVSVVQYIICDAKVVAKTLTISQAAQGIKRVLLFPRFKLLFSDRRMYVAGTVTKGYELFKRIHSATSTQV
jgi:hypothetical protein